MAAYVSIQDMRDQGVSVAMAADAKITAAVADASARAEAAARTWWESRTKTLYFSGSGHSSLNLDIPLLTLTSVTINGVAVTDVVSRPDPITGRTYRLVRSTDLAFPFGSENIVIVGTFGTMDMSGSTPATPADIKMAIARWAYLLLALVTDEDMAQERRFMTSTSVNVVGRSQGRGPLTAPLSGDPEVDRIIASYRRARVAVI